jgi:hypothetical protein
MSESVIDGPGKSAGPVSIGADGGVLCMSGVMTAGYVTVEYKPEGSDTFFPCDEVDVQRFERVRRFDATGHGFCTAVDVPRGGQLRVVGDAAEFAGALTVFLGSKN